MEKTKLAGLLFIVLSVLLVSIGAANVLNNSIYNGEVEITKDETEEVNKYLKDKYGIKSNKTYVFEEYYKLKNGNTVAKISKDKGYTTNRIYLANYEGLEFYVKKESNDKEEFYDNYVNVYLNNRLSNYLTKKYSKYNIKDLKIEGYDNSKYILQNNSSLYSEDLLKISNKKYMKIIKDIEQEISIEVKDKLNKKNIKSEVKKLVDTVNKEKEINVRTFRVKYQNELYIEYYKGIISIYGEDKEVFDKFIVLDKNIVFDDSIYIDDFMKLDNDTFNF